MRWKPALNAFATTFADRFSAVLPNFGPPNYALGCAPWGVRVGSNSGPRAATVLAPKP
jgi:hypothetical protein